MGKLIFTDEAWTHYLQWQSEDARMIKRIHALIQSIQRDGPGRGIGKAEKLKYREGWSRRIDDHHRLVYDFSDGDLTILDCFGHYDSSKKS